MRDRASSLSYELPLLCRAQRGNSLLILREAESSVLPIQVFNFMSSGKFIYLFVYLPMQLYFKEKQLGFSFKMANERKHLLNISPELSIIKTVTGNFKRGEIMSRVGHTVERTLLRDEACSAI